MWPFLTRQTLRLTSGKERSGIHITGRTNFHSISKMPLSASERKKVHESSEHVFPKGEKRGTLAVSKKKALASSEKTSYSIDYAKKEGKPALPRPCSVTRRNRPHPSQVCQLCFFSQSNSVNQTTTTLCTFCGNIHWLNRN